DIEALTLDGLECGRSPVHAHYVGSTSLQNARHQRTSVFFIVDYQNAHPVEAWQVDYGDVPNLGIPLLVVMFGGRIDRDDGKGNHERGSQILPGALHADRAAVKLDEVPHDRQAEAQSSVATCCRGVGLAEAIKDVG